ncbi:MAG: HDIG domain-containing metalloprotein [Candidatus Aminicenantales bacterium]|jgi:putative nucleotidyltransferase with HDIG domain
MSLISFDKIKLFKGAEIQPRKAPVEPAEEEKAVSPLQKFLKSRWTFLVLTVTLISLFLSYLPRRSLTSLALGEISPSDIVAPFDLTVQDNEATNRLRAGAENAVLPVYTFDPNVFANTEDKIHRLFVIGWAWVQKNPAGQRAEELRTSYLDLLGIDLDAEDVAALVRLKFPKELEETLVGISAKIFGQGIILSKNLFIHGEQDRGLTLLALQDGERTVKVGDILDLKESEVRFAEELGKIEIPQKTKTLLTGLAQIFLTPNITYNKIETENRKSQAQARIATVTTTIKKGRVVVRKGDEAGPEAVRILDLYNQRLQRRSSWLPDFAGSFLLFLLLFGALWRYLIVVHKRDQAERSFRMTGIFLVASLALYKISLLLAATISGSISSNSFARIETYHYAIPFQVGTLIFAYLLSDQLGLSYAVLNSLAAGYLLGANFYLMLFCLVGGLAAIYGVRYFRKSQRAATLRAGFLLVPPANAAVILIVHLVEKRSGLGPFSAEVFMGLMGGIISGALAFLLLPAVETAFGFITASKLLELTNSDLPVFRQMSQEAPGSYHHSLIVATLAEKGAEELGLDTQLVKAGALYHDIGKTKMPEYFIENRTGEFDLHKDLTPAMSTLVIINHVKEGAEIAKKLRLPRALREIIEQHHGNSLVRFFFNKAKQTYDPEQQTVGEESYRYPGPPPRTKEAALVMLADSVEAASRSLRSPTKDNLKRVITDIFNTYLQDGQLDDCDFSLRDLRAVASSFLTILFAIYHPRVEYPGFDFEVKKARRPARPRKKDNDRDHQPPEKTPGPDQGV